MDSAQSIKSSALSVPHDGPAILDALQHACSQDVSLLKAAEQQLKAWETCPGFYTILMVGLAIINNSSILFIIKGAG